MRYFDTTVLSRRVFGDEAERLAAAETVAEDTAITSKYVFQEYLLTFMDAAIWLHKLLVDSPSKKEALARFHKIRPPDSRKIRAHQVCVAVMDEWGESREELIDRLEVWIEHFILDYFWEGIACCMNETNCRRCAPVPKREGNRFSLTCQCAAHNPQGCGIEAFWNEREQALQKLKNSAEKLPKQRTVCAQMQPRYWTKAPPPRGCGADGCLTQSSRLPHPRMRSYAQPTSTSSTSARCSAGNCSTP